MSDNSDRLDSWKAIAEYLGRDVRTLRRWEGAGLPVRRVPGGKGHSVFAYKSEIDGWMARKSEPEPERDSVDIPPAPVSPQTEAPRRTPEAMPVEPVPSHRSRWLPLVAAAMVVGIVVTWKALAPSAAEEHLAVEVSEFGVVARASDGVDRWRSAFPAGEKTITDGLAGVATVLQGMRPQVLVATSYSTDRTSSAPSGGTLRQFTMDGQLRRTFAFDDHFTFGAGPYGAPWAIVATQADTSHGRTRVAVVAHHYNWWPSVVTILNERWEREGTFVNGGWMEAVQWLPAGRLAVAGFHQADDSAMVALLDGDRITGHAPDEGRFACADCPDGEPLVYVTMPRSELNVVTSSEFNRATFEWTGQRLMVHTSEVERPGRIGSLIDAVYEFSPSLDLLHASYSDRYWDKHRALEEQGVLKHSRAECPERDGPREVRVFTPATGWRTLTLATYFTQLPPY